MAMIVPLLSGTSHFTTMTAGMTTLVSGTVQEFFQNFFLHPGAHSTAVMIVCGATVAACVGLAFLVQKAYEKLCPERRESPSNV